MPYKVVRLKQPGFLSVVTSKSIKANHIIGVQFGEFRNTAKECVTPFAHNFDTVDPAVLLSSLKGVFTTSDITKRYTIQDHLLETCSIFYEQIMAAFNKIKKLEELSKKTTNVRLVNLFQAKIDQQKLIIKDAKEEFEKMDKSSKIIQDYEFDFLNGGKLCPVIENGIAIGSGLEMVNSEMPNKTGIVPPDKVNFDILGSCILNIKEKKYAILIYFTKEDMPANHPILDGYGSNVYASEHGYQPIRLDHRIENMDDLNPNKS